MALRKRGFVVAAAAIAMLLLFATSQCVITCVAASAPGAPPCPCHRHAPDGAKTCRHAELTAMVQNGVLPSQAIPGIQGVQVSESAAPALAAFDPVIVVTASTSPPPFAVLRI